MGAVLELEELGMGLKPFARQPVPRGRKKGKSSEVSVREQSRQASSPSWCHSGAERGLTKEFRCEIRAAAKSIIDELRPAYLSRNYKKKKKPVKPPTWYQRSWKTFSQGKRRK